MDTIQFGNGIVHECTKCNADDNGNLYVAITGVTFAQAAALFSDASAIRELRYGSRVYYGYTTLKGLVVTPYGYQASLYGGRRTA